MAGMTKEQLEELCREYDIDVSGLKWNDAVKKANMIRKQYEENNDTQSEYENIDNESDIEMKSVSDQEYIRELESKLAEQHSQIRRMKTKYENYENGRVPVKEDYDSQPIMEAPEMSPNKNDARLSRYSNEEVIGKDMQIEEISYSLDDIKNQPLTNGDQTLSGSYRIKGKGNKVVTALTRGPRSQAGIYWYNTKDKNELFKTVTFNGVELYQWSHVRAILKTINGGSYLTEYKEQIKEALNPAGNQLGIDKSFTHWLVDQIERQEQDRLRRNK